MQPGVKRDYDLMMDAQSKPEFNGTLTHRELSLTSALGTPTHVGDRERWAFYSQWGDRASVLTPGTGNGAIVIARHHGTTVYKFAIYPAYPGPAHAYSQQVEGERINDFVAQAMPAIRACVPSLNLHR